MKKTMLNRLLTVFLFLFFAIPGFLLSFGAAIEFCSPIKEGKGGITTQLVCALTCVIGSFMMLLGVGKWGAWRYLYVFLSIPVMLCVIILIIPPGDKFVPAIIVGIVYYVILRLVRSSYEINASRGDIGEDSK